MAAFKKRKEIKIKESPNSRYIALDGNPKQFYSENPAWTFANSDQKMWTFTQEHIGNLFWTELLPKLKALESQKWSDILIGSKKQNHALEVTELNKVAQIRLEELFIEAESLIALRINGSRRLYGYMTGRVFNILWYDDKHGDNDTCVCRSHIKHT